MSVEIIFSGARRFLITGGIALFLALPVTVAAASFEEGSAAYRGGNYASAREIWTPLANAGDANAQYALGYLYQYGMGAPVDTTQAARWYEKSARQGDRDAQYALGTLLQFGDGVTQNFPQALAWFQKAAEGEPPFADAEFAIARLYFRGLGVPLDLKRAIEWLKKASDHNNPAAHFLMGASYESGAGLPEDKVKAYYYYTLAWRAGTKVVQEYDTSYDPEAALIHLKAVMSKEQIARAEQMLKAGSPNPPSAKAKAKAKAKAAPKAKPQPKKTK